MDLKTKYGKVTFRIFRDDKAAQISIDAIIIRYYAVFYSLGTEFVLIDHREILEHLTPVIQKLADKYSVDGGSTEFSLLSYIKYHLLDEMFKSSCVGNLRAHVRLINI